MDVVSASDHYDALLAVHYLWMSGPFDDKVAGQRALFERLGIQADGASRALDLGSGPGYQAIALAQLGFHVTALDTSPALLAELEARRGVLPVATRVADIEQLDGAVPPGFDLAVCMGDTLTHLSAKDAVERLFRDVAQLVRPGGRLVLGYRDLSAEPAGTTSTIPVRSDGDHAMTCTLNYERDTVVVTDTIRTRTADSWTEETSSYRKLRLPAAWIVERLRERGFVVRPTETRDSMTVMLAERASDGGA
jgi:SAM-dependent methyltransferase